MLEKMWGQGNTPPLMVGMKTGTTALEISMAISQKIRKLSQDPEIPLFGKYPKNAESYQKDMCSTMFIAALFVIAITWKQPKWIKKI